MASEFLKSVNLLAQQARLNAIADPARRCTVSKGKLSPEPRGSQTPEPRLELFHFGMSTCSQKVRAALFQIDFPFASSELIIMPPFSENYAMEYVELRMASALARSRPLVASYSGSSSVANEGFDPLAVPTLVDHVKGEVVADSRLISAYLDRLSDGKLVPLHWQDRIWQEVDIIDTIPHAGLFYGANPDGDTRPEEIRAGMREAHSRKIELIRRRRDGLALDSILRDAYKHKIMKEEAGRAFIAVPANMRGIITATRNSIVQFERRLLESKGEWIVPDGFTLADIFWGGTLFRLLFLGYDWMWKDCPRVAGYAERVFAAPAIQRGIINWPGHPPGDRIERFRAMKPGDGASSAEGALPS